MDTSNPNNNSNSNNNNQSAIPQLNDFEDDDEFEDFGTEGEYSQSAALAYFRGNAGWDPKQSNPDDAQRWLEDWDSENIDDDFTKQLR
ncbi:hypothetical protein BC830DRAFT_1094418 [Chytriomyces sp. MP71]|nr:hypothetical protein BC830DRAFT_1094418 [Chytriomyces sp. MP71]